MGYSKKNYHLLIMMELLAAVLYNFSLFANNPDRYDNKIISQPEFNFLEPDLFDMTTTGSNIANAMLVGPRCNIAEVKNIPEGFTHEFI